MKQLIEKTTTIVCLHWKCTHKMGLRISLFLQTDFFSLVTPDNLTVDISNDDMGQTRKIFFFFPPPQKKRMWDPKNSSRFEFSTSKNLPLDISHDDLGGINKNPFFPSPPPLVPPWGCDPKDYSWFEFSTPKNPGGQTICTNEQLPWPHPPPSPPTWALRLIKFHLEAIFDISDLKNLGIGIHRATSWYFIFGLHFEAKEAVIQPLRAQGPILRPSSKSVTQKTYNLIYIKLYSSTWTFQFWPPFGGWRSHYTASGRSIFITYQNRVIASEISKMFGVIKISTLK